jgi:hypothetical protein
VSYLLGYAKFTSHYASMFCDEAKCAIPRNKEAFHLKNLRQSNVMTLVTNTAVQPVELDFRCIYKTASFLLAAYRTSLRSKRLRQLPLSALTSFLYRAHVAARDHTGSDQKGRI